MILQSPSLAPSRPPAFAHPRPLSLLLLRITAPLYTPLFSCRLLVEFFASREHALPCTVLPKRTSLGPTSCGALDPNRTASSQSRLVCEPSHVGLARAELPLPSFGPCSGQSARAATEKRAQNGQSLVSTHLTLPSTPRQTTLGKGQGTTGEKSICLGWIPQWFAAPA